MNKRSFMYRYSFLYTLILKLIHGKNLNKRYQYLASLVKKGDSVLEPACGPGILAAFLPKEASYFGFDTNQDFIDYGQKKKLKVYYGNVLAKESYQEAKVVIACDILHHLDPLDRETFIEHCLNFCQKRLIICDSGRENNLTEKILKPIKSLVFELLEKDGTNQPKYQESFTKEKLRKEMENGFKVIPNFYQRRIKEIGADLIVSYEK